LSHSWVGLYQTRGLNRDKQVRLNGAQVPPGGHKLDRPKYVLRNAMWLLVTDCFV